MGNKVVLGAVVLLIGGFLGWYVYSNGLYGNYSQPGSDDAKKTSSVAGSTENGLEASGGAGMSKGGLEPVVGSAVSYTDTGFSPSVLSVKKGTAVTYTNASTRSMWVASAPHPSHTILPEFDELTSVGKGGTYTFTFAKVGTWKYHNHMNPSDFGSVVVSE